MITAICPDQILALFKDDATKAQGRLKAVEWMRGVLPDVRDGDEILIPNPETGALMSYTKQPRKTQA